MKIEFQLRVSLPVPGDIVVELNELDDFCGYDVSAETDREDAVDQTAQSVQMTGAFLKGKQRKTCWN